MGWRSSDTAASRPSRCGGSAKSNPGAAGDHNACVPDAANDPGPATLLRVEGGVATITLNRPEKRNSLSEALVTSLAANLDAAIADPGARVIVVTGSGTVFCAGADLTERRTVTAGMGTDDDLPTFVRIFQAMQASPKPVVAKLNGHALAGGLGLACAADITIAPMSAKFGFTEVRLGVAAAIISVVCLPRMRQVDAARLFLTGERIDAAEAARVGLVTMAVPDDQLDAATDAIISQLLLGGPKALAASKELLRRVPEEPAEQAFRWTAKLSAELFVSEEGREGLASFAEKRQPNWVPSAG
jgi:methylglutaconyl-CoA hydratase